MITNEQVADRINKLKSEYEFPLPVLQDVQKRLSDSDAHIMLCNNLDT